MNQDLHQAEKLTLSEKRLMQRHSRSAMAIMAMHTLLCVVYFQLGYMHITQLKIDHTEQGMHGHDRHGRTAMALHQALFTQRQFFCLVEILIHSFSPTINLSRPVSLARYSA